MLYNLDIVHISLEYFTCVFGQGVSLVWMTCDMVGLSTGTI